MVLATVTLEAASSEPRPQLPYLTSPIPIVEHSHRSSKPRAPLQEQQCASGMTCLLPEPSPVDP